MATFLDFTKAIDLVYWCLFLFALFLFARKSNLVPTCRKDYKAKRFLLRKDVKFGTDHLLVHMKWSKTIQFGERVLVCWAHRCYLLDVFCSGIRFYLLLSLYLCFIFLSYLDLYVLGDDALIS